jgi:hypothetical protein
VLTIRFTLSRQEVTSWYRQLASRRWWNWVFVGFGVAMLAFGIAVSSPGFIAFGASYSLAWTVYAWFLLPRMMWRRFPQLRAEQVLTFSESGVNTELFNASTSTDWSFWATLSVVGDAYVLRAKTRGYCFVPRRAFPSATEEAAFRELVKESLRSARE